MWPRKDRPDGPSLDRHATYRGTISRGSSSCRTETAVNAQQRMDPGPHRKGLLQLNVAVLLGGVTGLFAKLVPLSAISLTCIRSGIAAVGLLLLLTRLTQQLAARAGPLVDPKQSKPTKNSCNDRPSPS